MSNAKLLKRIEQTESELAKLKLELNKPSLPEVPFWCKFHNGAIGRITGTGGGKCVCDNQGNVLSNTPIFDYGSDHLATPEEIEKHLIGLAKEKYKEGDKFKSVAHPDSSSQIRSMKFYYISETDSLYCDDCSGKLTVYHQGKWAEIVPSLPEYTMDELIEKVGHNFKLIN